jgi:hypothetical protein
MMCASLDYNRAITRVVRYFVEYCGCRDRMSVAACNEVSDDDANDGDSETIVAAGHRSDARRGAWGSGGGVPLRTKRL